MKAYFSLCCAAFALTVAPCAIAKDKGPQMSSLAIQAMQSRDLEGGKQTVFSSVMSVLQDEGYRIQSADFQTGLITGAGAGQLKNGWFSSKKEAAIVSAYIEQLGSVTRVRLNFVITKQQTSAWTGTLLPDSEKPVLDPAVYTDAFEKIGKAIFIRQSMMNPAKPDTVN